MYKKYPKRLTHSPQPEKFGNFNGSWDNLVIISNMLILQLEDLDLF